MMPPAWATFSRSADARARTAHSAAPTPAPPAAATARLPPPPSPTHHNLIRRWTAALSAIRSGQFALTNDAPRRRSINRPAGRPSFRVPHTLPSSNGAIHMFRPRVIKPK
uniref:Uncharacterized protein n=1 Tax=Plectus sambesii TaxID=2011161 RepID=A0A914WR06_9BILA